MRKLGKKESRVVPGALKLSKYLTALPSLPTHIQWAKRPKNWQELGNDTIGDCTCACAGHIIMEGKFANGEGELASTVTREGVIHAYSAVTGYVPGDESTDNGAYIDDVLSYWKKTGICGDKIAGYVQVNRNSLEEIQAAIYIFGSVNIGILLPGTAQTQIDNRQAWDLTPGYHHDPNAQPGSWGGHCVPIMGYVPWGFRCVTWGRIQWMSIPWFNYYNDEVWAVLDNSWLSPNKVAPNGIDLAQLQSDLRAL
jgi:hypothetical protein